MPGLLESRAAVSPLAGHPAPSALLTDIGRLDRILAKLNRAPGNNAPIGGLKVVAASGWFAVYPSRTEDVYRIYAESFEDQQHLDHILAEAREIVNTALETLNG